MEGIFKNAVSRICALVFIGIDIIKVGQNENTYFAIYRLVIDKTVRIMSEREEAIPKKKQSYSSLGPGWDRTQTVAGPKLGRD